MRSDIFDHRVSFTGRQSPTRLLSPATLGSYLRHLWQTHKERRALAELEPRLLRDMGIDPVAAADEIERPFWQLSAHHEAELRKRLAL